MRTSPLQDDGRLIRVQLRDHCIACLKKAGTVAGQRIYRGNPWPATAESLPALWLSVPLDTGSSLGPGCPQFSRTATVQIIGILMGNDPLEAQDRIDHFNHQVETALMTDVTLLSTVEEVTGLHTELELNSETRNHLARFTMSIELKYSETFPLSGPDLKAVTGTVGGL